MFWERKEVGPSEEDVRGNFGGGIGWKGGKCERHGLHTLRKRRNSMRSLSFSPMSGQSSTGRLDQSTVMSIEAFLRSNVRGVLVPLSVDYKGLKMLLGGKLIIFF